RQQLTLAVGLIGPAVVAFLRHRMAAALERERALRERAEAANHELLTLRAELGRHAQELEPLATIGDLARLCAPLPLPSPAPAATSFPSPRPPAADTCASSGRSP